MHFADGTGILITVPTYVLNKYIYRDVAATGSAAAMAPRSGGGVVAGVHPTV